MNIIVIGALPRNEEEKQIYQVISFFCKNDINKVKTPIDTADFKGSINERYELAFQSVKEADLIIAECSKASSGQGMEIHEAKILKKPIVVIAKKGSKISSLIQACPAVQRIIYYENSKDFEPIREFID